MDTHLEELLEAPGPAPSAFKDQSNFMLELPAFYGQPEDNTTPPIKLFDKACVVDTIK